MLWVDILKTWTFGAKALQKLEKNHKPEVISSFSPKNSEKWLQSPAFDEHWQVLLQECWQKLCSTALLFTWTVLLENLTPGAVTCSQNFKATSHQKCHSKMLFCRVGVAYKWRQGFQRKSNEVTSHAFDNERLLNATFRCPKLIGKLRTTEIQFFPHVLLKTI